jgi:hypothetical protein
MEEAFQVKQDLVNYLERSGKGVVDVPNSQDNILQTRWQPSRENFEKAIVPIDNDPAKIDQVKLKNLVDDAMPTIERFKTLYEGHRDLFTALPIGTAILDTRSIDALEQRVKRLTTEPPSRDVPPLNNHRCPWRLRQGPHRGNSSRRLTDSWLDWHHLGD